MFTYTSVEIVKSVGSRRISHLVCENLVRNRSAHFVEKSNRLQPLNYYLEKDISSLKQCLKASRSYNFLQHRSCQSWVIESSLVPYRHYQTKSKDCNKEDDDDNSEVETKAANVLDDLEFQSVLKDFARDFGVTEDSSKFLDEIKRSQVNNELNDGTEQSHSKAASADHQQDIHSGESETLCKQKDQGFCDSDSGEVPQAEETEEDPVDEFYHIDQELEKSIEYDVKRGKEGVYDIGDLVAVLKEENVFNIAVIQIPKLFHYTDYLVLATAKSPRHCNAVVEFIIKLHKKKKNKSDPFIKCEGKETAMWKALDMGNIILHVFLEDTRNFYDIESLWLLDRKYDSIQSMKGDPEMDMMQQHLDFLNSLNSH